MFLIVFFFWTLFNLFSLTLFYLSIRFFSFDLLELCVRYTVLNLLYHTRLEQELINHPKLKVCPKTLMRRSRATTMAGWKPFKLHENQKQQEWQIQGFFVTQKMPKKVKKNTNRTKQIYLICKYQLYAYWMNIYKLQLWSIYFSNFLLFVLILTHLKQSRSLVCLV